MAQHKLFTGNSGAANGLTGRYFDVIAAAGVVSLTFEFDGAKTEKIELTQGRGIRFDVPFKAVWVKTEFAQTITVWSGMAEMTNKSGETTINGATAILNGFKDVPVNTLTKVVPQQLGRRSVLMQADSPFLVGGENLTTDNGIEVDGAIEIKASAALYVLSGSAIRVKYMAEVN
ncbi:hypothetical protein [Vibrio sp. SCSIO 43137]|uniref:hypothetical protein n=1 Tax=Vibrio sp. SCSIO 43137 TaxID=3021011 RepID=UPI0023073C9E|nr:hypothetical protein [Vibrio sp. SCSIO 43137]WCE31111.1 hypothetical protein PK654_07555 [Vibrio sp. SCSIO 43137]